MSELNITNNMPDIWVTNTVCADLIVNNSPFSITANTIRNWGLAGFLPIKRKHKSTKITLYNVRLVYDYLMKPVVEEDNNEEVYVDTKVLLYRAMAKIDLYTIDPNSTQFKTIQQALVMLQTTWQDNKAMNLIYKDGEPCFEPTWNWEGIEYKIRGK